MFTPDSDAPFPVTVAIVPLSLPGPIENFHPNWVDCSGDGCPHLQQGFPQWGDIRMPDGSGAFTGLFRSTGAFGWRLSMVPGQPRGCYGQFTCNDELRSLQGYGDDDGKWIATLEAPRQPVDPGQPGDRGARHRGRLHRARARASDSAGCDTGFELDDGDAECTLRAASEALNVELPDWFGPVVLRGHGVAPDGAIDLPVEAISVFDSPRTRIGGDAAPANVIAASRTG